MEETCVAELNEDRIAKMAEAVETYERPTIPKKLVVCLDEKPVTLHARLLPGSANPRGAAHTGYNGYNECAFYGVHSRLHR